MISFVVIIYLLGWARGFCGTCCTMMKNEDRQKTSWWLSNRCDSGETLPAELGEFTALKYLLLSNNKLSVLSPEIGQLTNLNYLDLSTNQLSALPREIGELTNLKSLSLSNNQLSVLPLEISKLTNLQSLWLNNNQFATVPTEIGLLKNLGWLYLAGHPLSCLPSEVMALGSAIHPVAMRTLPVCAEFFGQDTNDQGSCQIQGDCISSRNYPFAHENHELCEIVFTKIARLDFENVFELEAGFDFLKFDGVVLTSRPSGWKSVNAGTLMSFRSDRSVTGRGFKFCARENSELAEFFGEDVKGQGSCQIQGDCVSSRNFPSAHRNHESCELVINKNARLDFENVFELEAEFDFLKFNGVALTSRPSGGKAVSAGTSMTFTSDGSITQRGFKFCVRENSGRRRVQAVGQRLLEQVLQKMNPTQQMEESGTS